MTLSDVSIRSAKPRDKAYKLSDGQGLYLLVNPNGSRWWRFKYRINGREKLLSLGTYPDTSAKLAREQRDAVRKQLAENVDPSEARQATKNAAANSFEMVAREWLTLQEKNLAPRTYAKAVWTLQTLVFPYIGSKPIDTIKAVDTLRLLKRIEARGLNETAHRTKQRCSQVFRYGVATGRCERDVTFDLRGALAPVVSSNHASIKNPVQIGQLLRDIESYQGHVVTSFALRIAPHVFVRPGELRYAEWSEFELGSTDPQWRIPAKKTKMRERHIVPLSSQVVRLLRELHPLTGNGQYLFPAIHTTKRPISENTVNVALRRMGYDNETMTGHGFRSMASTCLNEQGWNPDLIELQLAHAERDGVRAAYNKAQRLTERRKMMQAWSDYLDRLRSGTKVIQIKHGT